MTQSQRQALYNQFKHMDNNELTQIINDNSYDALAKEVAQEILSSDRQSYYQRQASLQAVEEQQRKNEAIKANAKQINPLYDDIHQIAQDLRFIKNSMIAGGVIAAIVIAVFIILILLH